MSAPNFPELEERILKLWRERDVFRKTMEKPAPAGDFVFYEGPPGANGRPGIHHLISRAYKDVVLRYRTMRGYRVERKAGWDTHGLPVELEAERKLGVRSKQDIERIGVEEFNATCRSIAWTYVEEWNRFTERSGYWLDLAHPYITYEAGYMESLWWAVRKIHERGLLYEEFRVVPHCPRCVTTLSAHEVALGYDETEDPSVYVRFKIRDPRFKGASFLVWTTTPWTLPANAALAVGNDVDYVEVEVGGERLILARARLGVLGGEYRVLRECKGTELVGAGYEPLFTFVPFKEKAHFVAHADFVSTDEGTGIVHIAPMYGADDFELGKSLGFPREHLVNERGEFVPAVTPWSGTFIKSADPLIIADLESRGALFRAEKVRHTYPFCWRCRTPLLYYAKPSWFFRTSAVAEAMAKANAKINWEPKHLRDGRFGEWLKSNKDWAVSRERYWATPLPVWRCASGHESVVGSFEELEKRRATPPATILLVRHGEATNNVEGKLFSANGADAAALTEKGKRQVAALARKLGKRDIAAIYSSPVRRTRETAESIARAIGRTVSVDDRIRELEFGVMSGTDERAYHAFYVSRTERWTRAPEGGETWAQLRSRMMSFAREIDRTHPGETVVVVTHGDPLYILDLALHRVPVDRQEGYRYPSFASATEVTVPNLPWDADGVLDPHRPYIDAVRIACAECGEPMRRIPDVMDVWFDSGAMPFAQWHYPFEGKARFGRGGSYQADYISEAIDQTRGWFYTLVAVNALLGHAKPPMKNVICMNHILDAKGQKMSKSKGNVVEPFDMFSRYGADALRLFFFTVNQPGDYKRFDEKEIEGVIKKVFLILWNVLEFYKQHMRDRAVSATTPHVLDRWLAARRELLVARVTEHLESYRPTDAGRAIAEFVNELSTWYLRRSRDRFRAGASVEPLRDALRTVVLLMAPMTPFLSEALYAETNGSKESVHLEEWPAAGAKPDLALVGAMEKVREIVMVGHALRDEAGIKLRQPLATVEVDRAGLTELDELLPLLSEELNVKEVIAVDHIEERAGWIVKSSGGVSVALRTEISEALRREGWMRELQRQVNDLRKEARLTPSDRITLFLETPDIEFKSFLTTEKEHLARASRASHVNFERGETDFARDLELDGTTLWVGLRHSAAKGKRA